MAHVALDTFIEANRDEVIARCRVKVQKRSPPPSEAQIAVGIPLFLGQLVKELRTDVSQSNAIGESALRHGHDLFLQGFSISEVVHDYGDVCQAITELAIERKLPIGTDDFRTLNRCLDDAIAGAVTEYAREQDVPRDGELSHVRYLVESTIGAFEVLQSGKVGVGGSTGRLIHRNLQAISAALDTRMGEKAAPPPTPEHTPSADSK